MKTREELTAMSKKEIDEYGETLGVKLDRRKKKDTMIDNLFEGVGKVVKKVAKKKVAKKKVAKKSPAPKKAPADYVKEAPKKVVPNKKEEAVNPVEPVAIEDVVEEISAADQVGIDRIAWKVVGLGVLAMMALIALVKAYAGGFDPLL